MITARAKLDGGLARLTKLFEEDAARPSMMGNIEPLRDDPSLIFAPLGIEPDPWQREVLESDDEKLLLLCSRQSGKSQIMSALALLDALLHPYAEVLILSKTLRQSTELLLKVKMLWRGLIGGRVHRRNWRPKSLLVPSLVDQDRVKEMGWDGAALLDSETAKATRDRALSMDLPNGARITSLPGNPDTIVGFSSVTMLIIDEASRTSDALYNLVRPFLAATHATHGRPGRLVVASTPFGKRGWFYDSWNNCQKALQAHAAGKAVADANAPPSGRPYSGEDGWLNAHWQLGFEGRAARPPFKTHRVTAAECPRITAEFLEEERAMIGARWHAQEYFCEFVDSVDSVFSHELIHGMVKQGDGEHRLWFEE